METILILGALAALLFSGLMVATLLGRARRPELRMAREVDLIEEADGEETLIRSLEPVPASPIDRTAPVLEIEPTRHPEPRLLPEGRNQDRRDHEETR
ncbi:hypothetical protein [Methylobacterium sp. J-068]|uniref:hypothetical protein n=1 Tax=Methylobacterium sp. J-068 TaxID=2836649 RepID=UPI001FBAF8BC|nr:hypothetical protein [Methylobacterium sp. J-068]MCJ2034121.1 hypothetical protein [Methylobacterium sp. J-068]